MIHSYNIANEVIPMLSAIKVQEETF
jgi:hypothetical protein